MHFFSTEEMFYNHRKACLRINSKQATKMPKECSETEFSVHENHLQAPFSIYANFEPTLKEHQNLIEVILTYLTLINVKIILLVFMLTKFPVICIDGTFSNLLQKILRQKCRLNVY